jgi:SWI/SNF-related matrix-associated actin-dependent regulator of chromatin subfamily A3
MKSKENPEFPIPGSDDIVQLWKRDPRGKYRNIASDFVCTAPPQLLSGGILADDMGLGKTLQIISLVLTGGPGATLIVAPVSVMSNWGQQAQRHVKTEHAPKVLIYHGTTKATPAQLMKYDIVVTSYGKLAREMEKGVEKVLLAPETNWRRVVLDEGHIIRNAQTKLASAACELKAQSRWVLSGTPMYVSSHPIQEHELIRSASTL